MHAVGLHVTTVTAYIIAVLRLLNTGAPSTNVPLSATHMNLGTATDESARAEPAMDESAVAEPTADESVATELAVSLLKDNTSAANREN